MKDGAWMFMINNRAPAGSNLKRPSTGRNLIAIGASTGGTEAICRLLRQLPKDMPGIVIVQHIPAGFSTLFAKRLDRETHFRVKEAVNGERVMKGSVYLAPGDRHMEIRRDKEGYLLKIYQGPRVSGHCPSVDVLFQSAAVHCKAKAIGVIMTGMGCDGARGITSMKSNGAITLGQDEQSSVVYGMARAASAMNGLTKQVSLDLMGHYITQYL